MRMADGTTDSLITLSENQNRSTYFARWRARWGSGSLSRTLCVPGKGSTTFPGSSPFRSDRFVTMGIMLPHSDAKNPGTA